MFVFLILVFAVSPLTLVTVGAENIAYSPRDQEAKCLLPPHPEHGTYTVSNNPSAMPGERYSSVKLDISCDTGYLNNNTIESILCVNGYWSASMPICVLDLLGFCKLSTDDLKVEYRCQSFYGTLEKSRECESLVPSGTVVEPICRSPAYFSLRKLSEMHCRDGMWDYIPICKPACGITTQHLKLEGTSTNHQELPWHAVIYGKNSVNNYQKCGGSLLTANKIISAARCFHDFREDMLLPASHFVVAVNKLHRLYNDTRDKNRQKSDVTDIIIPSSYRKALTYYEDNIAIAVVKTPFVFHLSVRPMCLDFDNNLDSTQLIKGNCGKTVGWNIGVDNDPPFEVLTVADFSYVTNEDCQNVLHSKNRQYLTKDKFCTRQLGILNKGIWFGIRDVGSGLAFLEPTSQRYYLQGVLSGYLMDTDGNSIVMYTSIVKHEHFIKQNL